jgi:hypothetical protein
MQRKVGTVAVILSFVGVGVGDPLQKSSFLCLSEIQDGHHHRID